MLNLLKDKKVIFFDVGYTLDAPASGDWMFTNKFLELAGEKMKQRTTADVQQARDQQFEGCAPLLCKEHATELSQLIPDFRNTFLMEW